MFGLAPVKGTFRLVSGQITIADPVTSSTVSAVVDAASFATGNPQRDLINFLTQFLPDIHRQLKQITVSGDVVSIELSIQGTFLGPFQTPAGEVKPTGAKIDFPTADFWYLRNGKVEVFDCHIAFTTLFAQLGILPNYAAAVAGSAPGGN